MAIKTFGVRKLEFQKMNGEKVYKLAPSKGLLVQAYDKPGQFMRNVVSFPPTKVHRKRRGYMTPKSYGNLMSEKG